MVVVSDILTDVVVAIEALVPDFSVKKGTKQPLSSNETMIFRGENKHYGTRISSSLARFLAKSEWWGKA